MSELQVIESAVKAAAKRRRWQQAWHGCWKGLLGGSSLILVFVALYKMLPLPVWSLAAAGVAGAAALPLGFFSGWLRRPDLARTAQWLDQTENLKERLSTALEFSAGGQETDWSRLVVRDAVQYAREIRPGKLLPFRLSRAASWSVLVLVVAAGLGFVPEYRSAAYLEQQRDRQNITEVGQRLAELTKRSLDARPPALEPTQKSMGEVIDLANVLVKNPPLRGEAVREVNKLAEALEKENKDLLENPAIRKLDQAAREQSTASGAQPSELQKQIEALQNQLGDAAEKGEALDKLKENLEQIKAGMMGLPQQGTPAGDAARQMLAEKLAGLQQQMKDLGQQLEGLEEAIAALEAGDTDLFLKDLDLAMHDLDKLRNMAKALQQLQQQMGDKIGKDLGEQLEFGQATAAIQTLNKMIEQLKSGELKPEQLQEVLAEVQRAVDPAADYGQVAEKLAKAAQNLQQGQKEGACQNLAEAAKELENLLEQMGDAQSLAAMLEALDRAQTAISTCKGWGQCSGKGPPRAGQGGKPGSGVGTWAEEDGWLYYPDQRQELWDNTGIVRPDQDPRGHTGRDVQEPDNLDPTKLKGKFSPGNSMPSITLKGVSIKGTSNVKYEEAAAQAQAEAQNALNQDKVPRAYRETVKDYFDDMKK